MTRPWPPPLRGRTTPWGALGTLAVVASVLLGLWLRVRGLSAEGFADDEIHKWLAANRYLHGDFGGDDVEHPMLMKSLIALAVAALPRGWAPETLTRLPNAVVGAVTVWATAQLGRRIFGRTAGLLAAALGALSTTLIGYQRIAKEDTLVGLFTVLALWFVAEAKAASTDRRDAAQRRWELGAAAAMGALLASKYYLSFVLLPILAYLAVRRHGGVTWRISPRRWAALTVFAFAVFAALDWTPFMPSTWDYFRHLFSREVIADRSVSESYFFMGRLWANMAYQYRDNVPFWYFFVFAGVKFAPMTSLLAACGLVLALLKRHASQRLILAWIATWAVTILPAAAKYARLTISLQPALFLLAASAAVALARAVARRVAPGDGAARASRFAAAALAVLLVVPEARATAAHAPHYRLYVSAVGGGDRNVTWFFPHCDYFDAASREAIAWVAAHAEPGAEICSEIEWPVRFYAERAGRRDLTTSTITAGRGCRQGRACYVLVQQGRAYRHNTAALERLSRIAPVHVEQIRGVDVVKVYRLDPGARLFPEGG